MDAATLERPMAKKKAAPKTAPVRLTGEAIRIARIASGYSGESVAEYVSRIVVEAGQRDIERGIAEFKKK